MYTDPFLSAEADYRHEQAMRSWPRLRRRPVERPGRPTSADVRARWAGAAPRAGVR